MENLNIAQNFFTGPLDLQHLPPSLHAFECQINLFSGLVLFDFLPKHLRRLHLNSNTDLYGEFDTTLHPQSLRAYVGGTNIIMIDNKIVV